MIRSEGMAVQVARQWMESYGGSQVTWLLNPTASQGERGTRQAFPLEWSRPCNPHLRLLFDIFTG
jgi:hypothetical protein